MDYSITELTDGAYQFTAHGEFNFVSGQVINPLILVYETFGELSPLKDNVILIHHALSTNSHICAHSKNSSRGWWEAMVGPNKAIDTNRFYVICINNLGSCFGSSGPASVNPQTNRPYRLDFPIISIEDIARSQYLLLNYLGINSLYAVIGNSMGAMVSLSFAILYPDMVQRLISVSSCYRSYPVSIAYHKIQQSIIQLDPQWKQGYYEHNPVAGLKIAREIGLLSYRDANDLNQRFLRLGNIIDYLGYNAYKLAQQFDANCYIYLINAMDKFDVSKGYADPLQPFRSIQARSLIISVSSDILFPSIQQQELHEMLQKAGKDAEFYLLDSDYGHDAFYADKNIGEQVGKFLRT